MRREYKTRIRDVSVEAFRGESAEFTFPEQLPLKGHGLYAQRGPKRPNSHENCVVRLMRSIVATPTLNDFMVEKRDPTLQAVVKNVHVQAEEKCQTHGRHWRVIPVSPYAS